MTRYGPKSLKNALHNLNACLKGVKLALELLPILADTLELVLATYGSEEDKRRLGRPRTIEAMTLNRVREALTLLEGRKS